MRTSITSYMSVGKTKTAGWQAGASRTVPRNVDDVWAYLVGPGLRTWLGVDEVGQVGETYTGAGGSGEVRSRTTNVRIRVTRRPPTEAHETTIQVALRPGKRGTTLVFHEERMRDAEERERARDHWLDVARRVSEALSASE